MKPKPSSPTPRRPAPASTTSGAQNAGKHNELRVRGQRDGRDRRPLVVGAGRQPVPGRPRPHGLRMAECRHRPARTTGGQATTVPASGRPRVGGIASDGDRGMRPLGLGEHGSISITREGGRYVAYLRFRDYAGKGHRVKRTGRSKAEASRMVLKAVRDALSAHGEGELTRKSTLEEAARRWLVMFEGLVRRGARSPSTLDEYRYVVSRVVVPGVGSLRLGEVTTPRLDQFVQAVLADRGYATAKVTRSVLSGICGWLVRRGALAVNPVRELTPLELDRDRTAGAFRGGAAGVACHSGCERVRPAARSARAGPFHSRDGLRLGEALGVTWADVDLVAAPWRSAARSSGSRARDWSRSGSSRALRSEGCCCPLGVSSCCGLGASGLERSRDRCSRIPGVAGVTGATWERPSGRSGAGRTSSG